VTEVLVPYRHYAMSTPPVDDGGDVRVTHRLAPHLRAITWLLLFVGISGSVVLAAEWRASVNSQAQHVFDAQSSDVASSAALSLARLDDLTATMRTAIATQPHMTSRAWAAWSADLNVTHRYPGSLGLAYAELVSAKQLAAYAATVEADPPADAATSRNFTVLPTGVSAPYCFIRLRSERSILDQVPIGLDLCDVGGSGFLTKPRDTGQPQVTPVDLGGNSVAAIFTAVYRGGAVPTTVATRRADIIGLVGGLFDVNKLLLAALKGHPGLSATLSRQNIANSTPAQGAASGVVGIFGASHGPTVGTAGVAPARSIVANTVTIDADGQWTVRIATSDAASQHEANAESLFVLFLGLLFTLMAFVLMRVLVRGRQRALDLVERRTTELTTSESRFRSLAAASPMGILQTDPDGNFLYGNRRLDRILGRNAVEMAGRGWLESFAVSDRERVISELVNAAELPSAGVDSNIGTESTPQWVRMMTARMVKDGALTGYVSTVDDVTVDIADDERLKAETQHDPLTGLPNRGYFLELLEAALADLADGAGQFAVLFIDLDRFKQVNDNHGHAVGDELLVATAERIAHALRPGDRVARLGGDEFAVLMPDISDLAAATAVVDRLQAAVARPFSVGGAEAMIGASVGLVLVDDPVGDPSSILQDADMAMYRAKDGIARFEVFDVDLRTSVFARFETEQALRCALERDDLVLHYQPVVKLRSGHITGGEALLRWRHPGRGLLLPGEFLPLAESTGLIVPIGDWTMRTAVAAAATWPADRALSVSINLSAQQLSAVDLLPTIEDLLMGHAIEARQVCVEVLETHLLDTANIGVLRELKRLGIQIAIDDFGSGYSSLLYLKRMPADVLKIDRALITDLAHEPDDRIIVSKLIELAHDLGVTVVAEGVEQPEQADILREFGCDLAQGFVWSPAVPGDQFDELLLTGLPDVTALTSTPTR
jgi:diguanylate cyclase (GGDEF)-like protein/PAS domain S-box-containing protein